MGHDLVASLNAAYELGELSISQRRGIITLLPKEDGSLLELPNWRPITLLNIDYKIASKAIAERLEAVLPTIVHIDQTGLIKGRYIGENIRLINDVMEHAKIENKEGILTSLDFKKTFDSLEWPLIHKTLEMFNFGDSLMRWVTLFYSNIESAVINNGYATKWFKPSKGVRQGCALSPYLFILSAEILSNKIRQKTDTTGISIFGKVVKISQFADDTNLFCANMASVENALKKVQQFSSISGLSLNVTKTKSIWLGKWEANKTTRLNLKWVRCSTKVLGVYVSYDEKGNNEYNFTLKVRKLQTKLDMWRARDLTLFGGVLIIKPLGLSELIYSISNLNVPYVVATMAKKKLFKFLWKIRKMK